MIRSKDFKRFFPFPKMRKNQKKAISFILNEFINNNKKYIIIEAGTGIGKSAIGITVSRFLQYYNKKNKIKNPIPLLENAHYYNSSYFLTTQKILQQQYIDDFGKKSTTTDDIEDLYKLHSISSSKNYECSFHSGISCQKGRKALQYVKKSSSFFKSCSKRCQYKSKKKLFTDEFNDGITNYSYFLAETSCLQESKPKELLVLDECHNVYNELSSFIEIKLSKAFLNKIGIQIPDRFLTIDFENQKENHYVFDWIRQELLPDLKKIVSNSKETLKEHCKETTIKYTDEASRIIETNKKFQSQSKLSNSIETHNQIEELIKKITQFLQFYQPTNWIINCEINTEIVKEEVETETKIKMNTIDHYFSKKKNKTCFCKYKKNNKKKRKISY